MFVIIILFVVTFKCTVFRLRQGIIFSELFVSHTRHLVKEIFVLWIAELRRGTPFKHLERYILYGVMPSGVNFLGHKWEKIGP